MFDRIAESRTLDNLGPYVARLKPVDFIRQGDPHAPTHAVYGPRQALEAGEYLALFAFEVRSNFSLSRVVIDAVDWLREQSRGLAEFELDVKRGKRRTVVVPLRFSTHEAAKVEFRLWTDNNAHAIRLREVAVRRLTGAHRQDIGGPKRVSFSNLIGRRTKIEAGISTRFGFPEIRVAFAPSKDATLELTVSGGGTGVEVIELVQPEMGAPFSLADGRCVLDFPVEFCDDASMNRQLVVRNGHEVSYIGRLRVPSLKGVKAGAHARRLSLSVRPDPLSGTRPRVYVREWVINETKRPIPYGSEVISERDEICFGGEQGTQIEFFSVHRACLSLVTGPQAGIIDIQWGELQFMLDLSAPVAGEKVVCLPSHVSGRAVTSEVHLLTVESLATVDGDVKIARVWSEFPLISDAIETAEIHGRFRWDATGLNIFEGYVQFCVGSMPALRLHCGEGGGKAIARFRDREIEIDLRSDKPGTVLVFPTLVAPIDTSTSPEIAKLLRRHLTPDRGRDEYSSK
jgi:hypothetical protein